MGQERRRAGQSRSQTPPASCLGPTGSCDGEEQRRPLFQCLVGEGALPAGYGTDNGVGLLDRGAGMVEAVPEVQGKGACVVERRDVLTVEVRLEPRPLLGRHAL